MKRLLAILCLFPAAVQAGTGAVGLTRGTSRDFATVTIDHTNYGADVAVSSNRVYVTHLGADDSAGSLRWAIAQTPPLTVDFSKLTRAQMDATGGLIVGDKDIGSVLQITQDNVTIAGETAPSPGITWVNGGIRVAADNVRVTHMRFRGGTRYAGGRTIGFTDEGSDLWRLETDLTRSFANDAHIQEVWFWDYGGTKTELTRASTPPAAPVIPSDPDTWDFDASDNELHLRAGTLITADNINTGVVVLKLNKSLYPVPGSSPNSDGLVVANCSFSHGTDMIWSADNNTDVSWVRNIASHAIGLESHIKGSHSKWVLFKADEGDLGNTTISCGQNLFYSGNDRGPRVSDCEGVVWNNVLTSHDGALQVDARDVATKYTKVAFLGNRVLDPWAGDLGSPWLLANSTGGQIYFADGSASDEANYFLGGLQTDPWSNQNSSGGEFVGEEELGTGGWTNVTTGTAQAGAATTITLAAGDVAGDDAYNNHVARITGGTGSGQQRLILDYTSGTKVADVSSAWDTNPDATSTYSIDYGVHPNAIALTSPITLPAGLVQRPADATLETFVKANVGAWPTHRDVWDQEAIERLETRLTSHKYPIDSPTFAVEWRTGDRFFPVYESDFSAGEDSWTGSAVTVTGNTTFGGFVETLQAQVDGTSGTHTVSRANALTDSEPNTFTMWVYVPSTNSHVDGLIVSGTTDFIDRRSTENAVLYDRWYEVWGSSMDPGSSTLTIKLTAAAAESFQDVSADDVIYFRFFETTST